MKEYILTEDKIEELRELLNDDSHSKHYVRTEIMKNLLPELFEEGFEVGKYYEFVHEECHFVFKVTKIEENGLIEGYGLDLDPFDEEGVLFEHTKWTDQETFDCAKEITQKEFMEHIKTYATEELGFKEGTVFNVNNIYDSQCTYDEFTYDEFRGNTTIANYDDEEDHLECETKLGTLATIFLNGKFAEIIEQPKKDGVCQPTMYLRGNKKGQLEQKWLEINTGEDEWREIEKA